MSYNVIIPKAVGKQIAALPTDVQERIAEKLQILPTDPRPTGVFKLKGFDNQYRIRVGDYRIRYEVDDTNQMIELLLNFYSVSIEEMFIESSRKAIADD